RTLIATTNAPDAVRQPIVNGLLAFESYGSDKILYVTETGAANGKVNTMLLDGETTYKIREHPAGSSYLLGLVRYDGNWIVTTGAAADNRVYVYKNPQAIRKAGKQEFLVPLRVLKVQSPNYLAFSSNTQLLMVQGGNAFATYDIENDRSYDFTTTEPLDAPAQHATWMDGHRIVYVSGGKLVVFDYDNTNRRTIAIMNAGTLPFFDRDYRNLYVLRTDAGAPGAPSKTVLSGTSLLTPADL
ncbi:MAG TPA: hypothetical protein VK983_03460, partial [Candidatus Limnocylindrales bacterium]|nr:hypothetical protein [Candidatus Limnocylindrales bacterium]